MAAWPLLSDHLRAGNDDEIARIVQQDTFLVAISVVIVIVYGSPDLL